MMPERLMFCSVFAPFISILTQDRRWLGKNPALAQSANPNPTEPKKPVRPSSSSNHRNTLFCFHFHRPIIQSVLAITRLISLTGVRYWVHSIHTFYLLSSCNNPCFVRPNQSVVVPFTTRSSAVNPYQHPHWLALYPITSSPLISVRRVSLSNTEEHDTFRHTDETESHLILPRVPPSAAGYHESVHHSSSTIQLQP